MKLHYSVKLALNCNLVVSLFSLLIADVNMVIRTDFCFSSIKDISVTRCFLCEFLFHFSKFGRFFLQRFLQICTT